VSVTFLGTKSVGAFAKGFDTLALPQLLAFLNELLSQQGDLSARLAVYANIAGVAITDPATMIAQIEAAILAMKDQIAAIVAGFIPAIPTFSASVDATSWCSCQSSQHCRSSYDQIKAPVSLGGVHLFSVDSTPADVGGELASLVSGGIDGGLPNARIARRDRRDLRRRRRSPH
jgi:hypothetical protein